jgi:hypothetical protein
MRNGSSAVETWLSADDGWRMADGRAAPVDRR